MGNSRNKEILYVRVCVCVCVCVCPFFYYRMKNIQYVHTEYTIYCILLFGERGLEVSVCGGGRMNNIQCTVYCILHTISSIIKEKVFVSKSSIIKNRA